MAYKSVRFANDDLEAIIDNTKSEFRIYLKDQAVLGLTATSSGDMVTIPEHEDRKPQHVPYRKGEIVYVKETWTHEFGVYWYRAGFCSDEVGQIPGAVYPTRWRPSTQMPREAARIFLEITDWKLQHLQDISMEELEREGIWLPGSFTPRDTYAERWNHSLSGAKRILYGWDKNPYVWVFSFRLCEKPEDWDEEVS